VLDQSGSMKTLETSETTWGCSLDVFGRRPTIRRGAAKWNSLKSALLSDGGFLEATAPFVPPRSDPLPGLLVRRCPAPSGRSWCRSPKSPEPASGHRDRAVQDAVPVGGTPSAASLRARRRRRPLHGPRRRPSLRPVHPPTACPTATRPSPPAAPAPSTAGTRATSAGTRANASMTPRRGQRSRPCMPSDRHVRGRLRQRVRPPGRQGRARRCRRGGRPGAGRQAHQVLPGRQRRRPRGASSRRSRPGCSPEP
jgi:hypothetical protein